MSIKITKTIIKDIRFPTSKNKDGSDAMNPDPDYSAAYIILQTNQKDLEGHGLAFTIGRGNEICCQALQSLSYFVIGEHLADITSDFAGFWRKMIGDSQFRWLGPEKGVIHMAAGAIINATWDLYAKVEKKPLWKLIADMTPEDLISTIDFGYLDNVLAKEEALEILKKQEKGKTERIKEVTKKGYPGYTTSAGWLGYSESKIRKLCKQAVKDGWDHIKMKVGMDLEEDIKRAAIIREEIGTERKLMMDANQKWGVREAIKFMKALAKFDPYWIEEPTHPDDILGHAEISKAIHPIRVATGEHGHNMVMFKQFFQQKALQVCQIDATRVGGLNENLAIMLMAKKFNVPVCPHGGGVGLCEYVQHLSVIDFVCISGTMEDRVLEYVDHLHEHFIHPVTVKKGRYFPPTAEGFSVEMKKKSLHEYLFPDGQYWSTEFTETDKE